MKKTALIQSADGIALFKLSKRQIKLDYLLTKDLHMYHVNRILP